MESSLVASVTLASILSSLSANDAPVTEAVISTHISPAIAGQWQIELDQDDLAGSDQVINTYQNGRDNPAAEGQSQAKMAAPITKASCEERYNFGADNQFWVVSGSEWTYGKYFVTHPSQGLPIIAARTIYDNNEVDCSGNRVDQSGEAMVAYLNHQGNRMQWCADSEGKKCFASFYRVLP